MHPRRASKRKNAEEKKRWPVVIVDSPSIYISISLEKKKKKKEIDTPKKQSDFMIYKNHSTCHIYTGTPMLYTCMLTVFTKKKRDGDNITVLVISSYI